MLRCIPFLLFDGNFAEAMAFYQKCLGGELTLTKLGDTFMKDQFPQKSIAESSMLNWLVSP
jgi:PhnB protein